MKPSDVKAAFRDIAARKLAKSSEASYRAWIFKYLDFLASPKCPRDAPSEVKMEKFLTQMAHDDYSRVSQNQAFNAILFLYRHVIKKKLGNVKALRAKTHKRERYVPSPDEVRAMFAKLKWSGSYNVRLAAALLYGCGLRVSECCEIRLKDIDLERLTLTVYEGKGGKDRQVRLPAALVPALRRQMERAEWLAKGDIETGLPVQLPGRLAEKYKRRPFELRWHFLFPLAKACRHPRTQEWVRYHMLPDAIQRAVKIAAEAGGVPGKVTPHCLRHCYCTHLLDSGENIARVQQAMGHMDVRTTAGYSRKECLEMVSPLDRLLAGTLARLPGRMIDVPSFVSSDGKELHLPA